MTDTLKTHVLARSPKEVEYLKTNPILHNFLNKVNLEIKEHHLKFFLNLQPEYLQFDLGSKYIRIWKGSSCWGFISRSNGMYKGVPVNQGDLLKPATFKAPAKHSRGNIIDGTADYTIYGPNYLK